MKTTDLKAWPSQVSEELEKDYFQNLIRFLEKEREQNAQIFPKEADILKAFKATPYDKVKVVILGQDPYHKKGQAHGLSFSVPGGVKPPPSLVNIYKELDLDVKSRGGDLTRWTEQGVFLLNSVLTVREGEAASHRNKGWENFTDFVLSQLNNNSQPIVFMLWGAYALNKSRFLNNSRHLVLRAPHPSPLSAYRGFFGCGHFMKANEFLIEHNKEPINWA